MNFVQNEKDDGFHAYLRHQLLEQGFANEERTVRQNEKLVVIVGAFSVGVEHVEVAFCLAVFDYLNGL